MVQAQKTSSTSSTSSMTMKGADMRIRSGSSLELIRKTESGFEVFDAACALVVCPTHRKIGLCKISPWKGLFFPVAVVSPLTGFEAGIEHRMKQLLQHPDAGSGFIGHRVEKQCIQYTRIQVPVVNQFVTRATFKVTITGSDNNLCCKDIFSLQWMTMEEVNEQKMRFWGHEVIELVTSHHLVPKFEEFTLQSLRQLAPAVKDQVTKIGYSEADVDRIFQDFYQHVYPSTRMSRSSLVTYLKATGIVNGEDFQMVQSVADVFDSDVSHYLNFNDFMKGLSSVDSESGVGTVRGLRGFRGVAATHESMENVEMDSEFEDVTRLTKGAGKERKICFKCEEESMSYASYAVTMSHESVIQDPLAIVFNDEDQKRVAERVLSREQVDHTSIGNILVRWIHDHAEFHANGHIRPFPKAPGTHGVKAISLWSHDPKILADYVNKVCVFLKSVMSLESRVVDLLSPVYVIGSLFASISDLLTFERLFWKRGLQFEAGTFVFDGNFSEHGDHSLEVLFYLLAIKSLAPHKVVLLRGQTEQRQRLVKVLHELKVRFGDTELMRNLRHSICSVFDVMPVAAVVNGHELIVPSSLPMTISSLQDLNHIPVPLSNPEDDAIAKQLITNMDTKNEAAIEQQMHKLGISSLIRSFEWSPRGVRFQAKGKIISFISCSNIKGTGNPSAILLIHGSRIKAILIQDPRFPVRSLSQSSLSLTAHGSTSSEASSTTSNAGKKSSGLSLLNSTVSSLLSSPQKKSNESHGSSPPHHPHHESSATSSPSHPQTRDDHLKK